ncbi:Leucine Rich repeats (2 copies) [Bremerella volcania]|uniref:Leucine Rich repeats (2 copies) n=1 Tax=Bremerella volcania TaxID=2527984 RepID=A0A518C2V8_9BACT|nr:hypothetical protein [Bremerella volcania]QDU73558.1 Leucine Rich repeats (2 copies) [Bremerella volcania]
MNNDQRWQELKQLNHGPPSELAFRALLALLDTWPPDDQAEPLAYADKFLSQWPDAVRAAPWSLCKAASRGTVLPTWQLVRTLRLSSNHLTKGTVDLAQLAHHASLEHITELNLPRYSSFHELSFLYHRAERFPKLKRLCAADKYNDADVRAIAESPLWQTLERFDTESAIESFAHGEPSRIVPRLDSTSPISHLSLRAIDLMAAWDASELPKLQSVCVFIRSIDEAKALGARRELSQLQSLSIAFRCGFSGNSPFEPFLGTIIEADEAAADAFFSQAQLDQLEKLTISGYSMGYWGREGLGELGLERLIQSGLLKRLTHLRLERLPLGDRGVMTLAPALGTQLESLELIDIYCKGEGAAALAGSPGMASLRKLDLSGNRIDADQIARLATVDMPYLESLDLSGPDINPYYWNVGVQPILDTGATAWANSKSVQNLKRLRLSNCHLTDTSLAAIFDSSQLRQLTELDLSHNSFTADGFSQLASSPIWQTLHRLSLNNCRLENDAIESLARVPEAPALRAIQLAYNSIGPRGAAALASWRLLESVWELDLHDNLIGDEGLIALAQSHNLTRLLELDLEQDCWNSRTFTFSDQAAQALADSTSLARLEAIFSGCVDEYHGAAYSPGFSKDALERLRRSEWMRPSLKASLSDYSEIDEYYEQGEFDENRKLDEHDFRGHPFTLNEREADHADGRMRQLNAPRQPDRPIDKLGSPKISPLPQIAEDDEEIEGLGLRDPIPVTDHFAMMRLSLEDEDRPLPNEVGKVLSVIRWEASSVRLHWANLSQVAAVLDKRKTGATFPSTYRSMSASREISPRR